MTRLSYSRVLESGFDAGDGELGYSKLDFFVQLPILELGYSRYDLDWNNAQNLSFTNGSSDPIKDLQSIELSLNAPVPITNNLGLMLGVGGSMAWEDQTSSSITYNGTVGAFWQPADNWELILGVRYSYHPDVDPRFPVFPMLGIAWNQGIEEGWSAAFGIPETEVRYAFSKNSSSALVATGDGGLFRLADDSPIAPAGFAELNQFGLGLQYQHKVADKWYVDLGVSYSFENEWRFYDSNGDRFATENQDGGIGFTIGGRFTF